MQIILKEVYPLCVAPPSPVNQESPLREDGGFYPLGFIQARQCNRRACQAATRPIYSWMNQSKRHLLLHCENTLIHISYRRPVSCVSCSKNK